MKNDLLVLKLFIAESIDTHQIDEINVKNVAKGTALALALGTLPIAMKNQEKQDFNSIQKVNKKFKNILLKHKEHVSTDILQSYVINAAKKYGVDPAFLEAIAFVESGYNYNVVFGKKTSTAGAKGMMQFMPKTAEWLNIDPLDPEQAADGAARYIKQLLKRFDNDLELTAAAYNAGPTIVAKHGKIPPYKETKNYVIKVMARMKSNEK